MYTEQYTIKYAHSISVICSFVVVVLFERFPWNTEFHCCLFVAYFSLWGFSSFLPSISFNVQSSPSDHNSNHFWSSTSYFSLYYFHFKLFLKHIHSFFIRLSVFSLLNLFSSSPLQLLFSFRSSVIIIFIIISVPLSFECVFDVMIV